MNKKGVHIDSAGVRGKHGPISMSKMARSLLYILSGVLTLSFVFLTMFKPRDIHNLYSR